MLLLLIPDSDIQTLQITDQRWPSEHTVLCFLCVIATDAPSYGLLCVDRKILLLSY